MGFLCVVLFLQVSNKSHLEAVDVLDVPKDDLQLVVIEHVHALPALAQVALQQRGLQLLWGFQRKFKSQVLIVIWLQGYGSENAPEKYNVGLSLLHLITTFKSNKHVKPFLKYNSFESKWTLTL